MYSQSLSNYTRLVYSIFSKRLHLLIPLCLLFVFSGILTSVAHAQQNEGSTRIQLPMYSPQNGHRISGAILEIHWDEYDFAVETFGFGERIPNGNQAVEGYLYNGRLYKTLPGLDSQEQQWFTSCGMIQLAGTVIINGTHEYQLSDSWAAPCDESWGSSAGSIDLPQKMAVESVAFKNVKIIGHDSPLVEREIQRLIERHLSEPENAPKADTGSGSTSTSSSQSSDTKETVTSNTGNSSSYSNYEQERQRERSRIKAQESARDFTDMIAQYANQRRQDAVNNERRRQEQDERNRAYAQKFNANNADYQRDYKRFWNDFMTELESIPEIGPLAEMLSVADEGSTLYYRLLVSRSAGKYDFRSENSGDGQSDYWTFSPSNLHGELYVDESTKQAKKRLMSEISDRWYKWPASLDDLNGNPAYGVGWKKDMSNFPYPKKQYIFISAPNKELLDEYLSAVSRRVKEYRYGKPDKNALELDYEVSRSDFIPRILRLGTEEEATNYLGEGRVRVADSYLNMVRLMYIDKNGDRLQQTLESGLINGEEVIKMNQHRGLNDYNDIFTTRDFMPVRAKFREWKERKLSLSFSGGRVYGSVPLPTGGDKFFNVPGPDGLISESMTWLVYTAMDMEVGREFEWTHFDYELEARGKDPFQETLYVVKDETIVTVPAGEFATYVMEVLRPNSVSTVYVRKKAPRIVKVEYDNGEVFELEKQFKWNGMRWTDLKGYYSKQAQAKRKVGDIPGAIADMKKEIANYPRVYSYQKTLGDIYYEDVEDYQKAIETYHAGLKLVPVENPSTREQMESILFLHKLIEMYKQTGAAQKLLEHVDKQLVIYRRLQKKYPDHIPFYNSLAYNFALKEQNLDTAETYIKKALNEEPDNEHYLDTAGWIYYKKGDYRKAQQYIEKALEVSSDPSALMMEHMGEVLDTLGERKQSRQWWQQACDKGSRMACRR